MPKKSSRKAATVKRKKSPPGKVRKAAKRVEPVPRGYHTITPSLIVHDGAAAIEFYVRGFGAREKERDIGPGGKVWHSALQVGDSLFMVMDEFPEMEANSARRIGDSPVSIWLYVKDVDKLYNQVVAAGATSVMAPMDQFWGDRTATVEDPFGHTWSISTRKEVLSRRELEKRRLAALEQVSQRAASRPSRQPAEEYPRETSEELPPSVTDFVQHGDS